MNDFTILEALAAELTRATYCVALRHETRASWIDLELELWKAVRKTLQDRAGNGHAPTDALAGLL